MSNQSGRPFTKVPVALLASPHISDGSKVLYGYLKWLQGTNGNCCPSVSMMATDLNVSQDTIRRRLTELEKYQYLSVTRCPGKQSWYTVMVPLHSANGARWKSIKRELTKRRRERFARNRDRFMLALIERDGYRCSECQSQDELTIDHIVPISKGGSDELNNLRLLCRSCNSNWS